VELSFQFVEGLGDSWLAQAERSAGIGESAVLDDCREESEVVEVHPDITRGYGSMRTMYWTHNRRNAYRRS